MNRKADRIFMNGTVYTIDKQERVCEAVAVENGKILGAGTMDELGQFIGSETQIVDLQGKAMLPGFVEGHIHAPGAAYNVLFNVDLYQAHSEQETMEIIKAFVEKNPNKASYFGRGFNCGFFTGLESTLGPKKERLDEICSTKPIVLTDFGGHMLWLNSKALEINNITKDTPVPEGGVIEKDPETGELWGVLKEYAKRLVPYQSFTDEEAVQSVEWFQNKMHSFGYTSVFALRPPGAIIPRETIFRSFALLEAAGNLKLRVSGARDMDPVDDIEAQVNEMLELKASYESNLIKMTTAKFFADGVIEGVTGSLLEPYEEAAGKGKDYCGEFIWDKERMARCFEKVMEAGFQIHVHSIGDGATHYSLDSMEKALSRLKGGGPGVDKDGKYRNVLTHLQLVHQDDLDRMRDMGVVANVQAYWHFKSPVMFPVEKAFAGERAEIEYPLKSFFDRGIVTSASADHPVTPVPNPFHAIQAGVTRNLYDAKTYGLEKLEDPEDERWLLNKSERVTVMDMVKAYTINGAYQLFREQEIGSIETGKYADMIVVDQDPFKINVLDLETIKVVRTIWNGETVFEQDK